MANNNVNNSKQENKKQKKSGFATWWRNIGKGGQIAICSLAGAAVAAAVTVPTVIVLNNNKASEVKITIIGAEFDKDASKIELNKDSIVVFTYDDNSKEFVKINYVKVGGKTLTEGDDYDKLDDGNSASKKIKIYSHAMKSTLIDISIELKDKEPAPETDKVINIWSTNKDIEKILVAEQVVDVDFATGKGHLFYDHTFEVNFTIYEDQKNYANDVINNIENETDPAKKIDIFTSDHLSDKSYLYPDGYVNDHYKFMDDKYSLDLSKCNIENYDALVGEDSDMFQFTIKEGQNANGVQKSLMYNVSPNLFLYRRSIAQNAFGTDDPETVQEKISGIDEFIATAEELKAKGCVITSSIDDAFDTCVLNNSKKFIVNDEIVIDSAYTNWLDTGKQMKDNVYTNNTTIGSDDWIGDIQGTGNSPVLGYICPFSVIKNVIIPNCGGTAVGEGTYGDWAVCTPPTYSTWGGNDIYISKNVTNKEKSCEIISELFEDLKDYSTGASISHLPDLGDETVDTILNTKSNIPLFNGELSFLGGQNLYEYALPAANGVKDIEVFRADKYQATCAHLFRITAHEYFDGNYDKDGAIDLFKTRVHEAFPDLPAE